MLGDATESKGEGNTEVVTTKGDIGDIETESGRIGGLEALKAALTDTGTDTLPGRACGAGGGDGERVAAVAGALRREAQLRQ